MRPWKIMLTLGLLFAPFASRAQVQNVPTPNSTYTGPAVPTICVSTAGVLSSCGGGGGGGKGGNALVAASQTYSNCTSSTTMQAATMAAIASTTTQTATSLTFSLTVAQGATATGDLYIVGIPLS